MGGAAVNKDVVKILKQLDGQGFTHRFTPNNRLVVYRDGRQVASISCNVRDWRTIANSLARLSKAGFKK